MVSQLKSLDSSRRLSTHSTVLHRLGASRKESLQNQHTYAVDSVIQLLSNNRVLNGYPPPIADEEQRLNWSHALSHSYDQDTDVYYKTTSIGCSTNQATSVRTVELHHKA